MSRRPGAGTGPRRYNTMNAPVQYPAPRPITQGTWAQGAVRPWYSGVEGYAPIINTPQNRISMPIVQGPMVSYEQLQMTANRAAKAALRLNTRRIMASRPMGQYYARVTGNRNALFRPIPRRGQAGMRRRRTEDELETAELLRAATKQINEALPSAVAMDKATSIRTDANDQPLAKRVFEGDAVAGGSS